MPSSDLADRTAALLSLAWATEEKSLSQLTTRAAARVPGCVAASVTVWRDGELTNQAASHREASSLVEIQVTTGHGPLMDVVAGGKPVMCPDTLTDARWPVYSAAALRMGIRSSACVSYRGQVLVAFALHGLRPRPMPPDDLQLAELVAWGGALVGAVADYGDTRRVADQLREAASSRAIVDQAKGILMHALGCSAEEALQRMREVSQRSNIRATEVAQRIIDAHGPSGRSAADGVSQLTDLAIRARRRP